MGPPVPIAKKMAMVESQGSLLVSIVRGSQGSGDGGGARQSLYTSWQNYWKVGVSPSEKVELMAANAATARVRVGLKMLVIKRGADLGSRHCWC